MKYAVLTGLLLAAAAGAQTVDTIPLRAVLQGPVQTSATVLIHPVRDTAGQITSATIAVSSNLRSPVPISITGLTLSGDAAGPRIDLGVSSSNPLVIEAGSSLDRQITISRAREGDQAMEAVRALIQDPSRFTLLINTPAGPLQAVLQRTRRVVLMALMRPENEVPPQRQQPNSHAVASIVAYASYNSAGMLSSGEVIFDLNVNHGQAVTFTGLHIHSAPAGVNGPVTIGTDLSAANPVVLPSPGIANIRRTVEVNVANAASRATLEGLFSHPHDYYVNLHSSTLPAGVIRAQLRPTDAARFNVLLSGTTPGSISVHTLRGPDAGVQAATVFFDASPRVAGDDKVTGLALATGSPTQPMPVIDSGISANASVPLAGGAGHVHRFVNVSSIAGTGVLDELLSSPARFYLTLRTAGGNAPLLAALAPPSRAVPEITNVIAAVSDPKLTTVAQGSLVTIFGNNLATVTQDLTSFEGSRLPVSINGVGVRIAGLPVPVLFASPNYMLVQVPFEVPAGPQPVTVFGPTGQSRAFTTYVAPVAPALYFGTDGAVATRLDYSRVTPDRPAQPSELIWLWATGFGAANGPQLVTGVPPSQQNPGSVAGVTAMVGGRSAEVLHAVPSPGNVGLYQVLIRVPQGPTADREPVVLMVNGQSSNAVFLPFRP